jgi:hypothetical protein
MFAIIPLDKILVSVISLEELDKVGTKFSGANALHCQAGQGGLAGIIISASPISLGGKYLGGKYLGGKTFKKRQKSLKKTRSSVKKKKGSLKKKKGSLKKTFKKKNKY